MHDTKGRDYGGLNSQKNTVHHSHKANLFKDIFSEPKYFIDLYRACSGISLKESDLRRFDMSSESVGRGSENDVSFLTKDNKLIIMVEHQSGQNPNMPERFLLYYAELMRIWQTEEDVKLSGNTKVNLPHPEFYIAYNGKKEFNKDLLQAHLGDFVSVKAELTPIHFEKLPHREASDYLAGYSFFIKTMQDHEAQGIFRTEAFSLAVQKCKELGYLKGIVERSDFMAIYAPIYDREHDLMEMAKLEGMEQGIEQGIERGIERGIEQGKAIAKEEMAYSLSLKTNLSMTPEELADTFDISIEVATCAYTKARLELAKDPALRIKNIQRGIDKPKL